MCNAVKNTEDILRFLVNMKESRALQLLASKKILDHLVSILSEELRIWHKDSERKKTSNLSNQLEKYK